MKTEQLIVQYLYRNKKVILQDIGIFNIAAEINIPEESEKDIVLPVDAIQFVYDPKAPVDDGLVAFIMESTRKIKPLAYSDLESFIILNKQFLNIGKPLIFEGMGTLQKTQVGDYAFTQATTSHVTTEEKPKLITEKEKEKISFATPQKETGNGSNKIILWILLGIVIITTVAGGLYFYNRTIPLSTQTPAENSVIDTLPQIKSDTSFVVKNAVNNSNMAKPFSDSNTFYIVIKEFTNFVSADKSFKKLTDYGNNLVLTTKDSVNFKLRMPFIKSLTDTLRIKDSLSKFFHTKAYVELP